MRVGGDRHSTRVPTAWVDRRGAGRDAAVSRFGGVGDATLVRRRAKVGPGPWRLSYNLQPAGSLRVARDHTGLGDPAYPICCPRFGGQCRPFAHVATSRLVDRQIAVFIEARRDERLDVDLSRLAARYHPPPTLSLAVAATGPAAGQVVEDRAASSQPMGCPSAVQPLLQNFSSKSRRDRLAKLPGQPWRRPGS